MRSDSNYMKVVLTLLTITDECIIAPGSPDSKGYAKVRTPEGGRVKTHQLVCEMVHGPKPFPEAEVAHRCGVPMCINPRHLRWDTRSGNQRDRRVHGTVSRTKAKLTRAQADAIRAEYAAGGVTHRSLAAKYGVEHRSIGRIISGKNWS